MIKTFKKRRYEIVIESKKPVERISVYVGKHDEASKYAKKYCPETFPIHCSFSFAKKHSHIADELKELVADIPKDKFRFRKEVSKYAGVSVDIFIKNADTMRPIVNGLKGKGLFADTLTTETPVFPRDLISMAQSAISQNLGKS